VRVKPGKGQSTAGFIVGLILCFIGIFMVIPTFGPFGILWTLFAAIMTGINGLNAFSNRGIASHEIIIDEEHNPYFEDSRKSSEERLNELQSLYEKGIITADEYQQRRKQIIENI